MSASDNGGSSGGLIGARVCRVEDRRLLTGTGRFVADVVVPRMAEAVFVRSPHAHARVRRVDVTAALASPGVVAVLTSDDIPAVTFTDPVTAPGLAKTPQPVLAGDRVRFVGEPIAIVVGESRYVAEDAAELVDVAYEPLPAAADIDVALAAEDERGLLFPELGSNLIYHRASSFGDPDGAFESADLVVALTYQGNRYVAAPIEGAGCVAEYQPGGAALTFWASTQSPHLLRRHLAAATGIPEHRIRVVAADVGGGFGQKIPIRPEEAGVAIAATRCGRAVRWIEDRQENLVAGPHAKEQRIEIELGVQLDGTFLGLRARIFGDAGAYSHNSASALIEPHHASTLMPGVYRIRDYAVDVHAVLTNKSPVSPYRGVGMTAGHVARELAIDRVARKLDLDPIEVRIMNMIRPDEFPYTSCTGMVYDSGSYQESIRAVAGTLGYETFRQQQHSARQEGRYLGIGITPFVEPTGWGTEGARQAGSSSFLSHDAARVSMHANGGITVAIGANSQGQGHETVLAQVAADVLSVPFDHVVVECRDTSAPTSTPGTRASRVAVVLGGAVALAASDVRSVLLEIAACLLDVDPSDLSLAEGVITGEGSSLTVAEVAAAAYSDPSVRRAVSEPHLTATRLYDPGATYSNGCIGAVVEVDPHTGAITIQRLVAAEDCGTVINPLLVEGQIHGGVAQGIGGALLERMVYDAAGQLLTSTFLDYLLPTATDVPAIEVIHLTSPSPNTWNGIKGMGESGAIGTPATLANAVADALVPFGVDVDAMPLTPQRIAELVSRSTMAAGIEQVERGSVPHDEQEKRP